MAMVVGVNSAGAVTVPISKRMTDVELCAAVDAANRAFDLRYDEGVDTAAEWKRICRIYREISHYSRLLLRDFMIAYHPVYPGDDGSPLKKDIDETDRLELAYGQNTFSFDVASINYDYPSNILYSWKIDGYHKEWTRPSQDNRILVRNLPPPIHSRNGW